MPASIDNFWLVLAVRHGLPAAFLMLLALLSIFLAVSFRKGLDDKLIEYRTGFLISMSGVFPGRVDGRVLGRCLCFLAIPDGQRRLDAGCETQGESCLAGAGRSS